MEEAKKNKPKRKVSKKAKTTKKASKSGGKSSKKTRTRGINRKKTAKKTAKRLDKKVEDIGKSTGVEPKKIEGIVVPPPEDEIIYNSKFEAEYCQMLQEHMSQGKSFDTFGIKIGVVPKTLYNWVKEYPSFAHAKEMGKSLSRAWWEDVGRASVTGTLRMVTSEKVALDSSGNPVMGADGKPVINKEFARTRGDSKIWSSMMRNLFDFKPDTETLFVEKPKDYTEMKTEEIEAEMLKIANAIGYNQGIEKTPQK